MLVLQPWGVRVMAARKSSREKGSDGPNPVDLHVGHRVRQRRILLGMSQERLAEALGLTFQQVQKYERGMNRVSASRLFDLARVLDCDVNYFFSDMPDEVAKRSPGQIRGLYEPIVLFDGAPDPIEKRETLELIRAYHRIHPDDVRRCMFELMKAVGGRG